MRYLTAYLDPNSGRENLGTGASAQCFHDYANVNNVIKFGLSKPAFPAGQYNIYAVTGWAGNSNNYHLVRVATKSGE